MLTLQNLTYQYPNGHTAVNDINLTIPQGKKIALMGVNGSGKSTLLRHLNGLLEPTSGQLLLNGTPYQYDRAGLRKLRETIGLIFQDAENQLFSATVAEDIAFGPLNLKLGRDEIEKRIEESAKLLEISDLLDRPIHALSGGQKMRVAIAGVLAMQPQVIVADEPLASLDAWVQTHLLKLFDRLVDEGRTIILTTHDVDRAYAWADEIILLENGAVLAHDTAEKVLGNPTLLASCGWEKPWVLALAEKIGLSRPYPRTRQAVFDQIN